MYLESDRTGQRPWMQAMEVRNSSQGSASTQRVTHRWMKTSADWTMVGSLPGENHRLCGIFSLYS
eukprot:632951-Amphidinium_carterae.4